MSLRLRLLLSILAVNLAVTGSLAAFFAFDVERKDEARRMMVAKMAEDAKRSVLSIFGDALGGREKGHFLLEVEDADHPLFLALYNRMEHHPIRSFIGEGVIQRCVMMEGEYVANERGEIVPTGAYWNVGGCKGRSPIAEDVVKDRILQAIRDGRRLEAEEAGGYWLAAPVQLVSFSERMRQGRLGITNGGPIWGGVYFQARRQAEPDWEPTFGSSLYWVMGVGTILLAILGWLLIRRWVLTPLGELSSGAGRVAQRRYDQPVPVQRADEVGQVIVSFNTMMGQVRDFERDLTQRVDEATQRDAESRRGLVIAQRLASTGTLASGIAHEINNPIGGMLNATARLRREAGDDASDVQRRYLDLLDNGLRRIQEIVRRVLTFSPRATEPTEVSLREIVDKAVALARHRGHGATFDVSGPAVRVLAEPGELQQVFLNLFLNAVDAMTDAGVRGEVRVRLGTTDDRAWVRVEDDGPGIDEADVERIFDLFFSTKDVGEGTGLGLSVAHHIVQQHGGTLRVEPSSGGAVFVVEFPKA